MVRRNAPRAACGSSTMHVSRLNRLGRVLRCASGAGHPPGPGRRLRPRTGRGRTGAEAAHPVPPRELADPRRAPDQRHPGAGPGRRRLSLARHRSRAGPLRRGRVPDLRSQQQPRAEGERRHRPVRRQRQPAVDRHRRRRRPAPARRRLRGVQPGPPVRLDQRLLPGSARRHLGRRRRFGRPGLRRTRWSSCAAPSPPSRRFTRTRTARSPSAPTARSAGSRTTRSGRSRRAPRTSRRRSVSPTARCGRPCPPACGAPAASVRTGSSRPRTACRPRTSGRCRLDHRGGLWIGTTAGVARLVGDRLVARTAVRDADYEGMFVTALLEDREGGIWVATRHGGLHQLRDVPFRAITRRDGTGPRRRPLGLRGSRREPLGRHRRRRADPAQR